MKEYNIIFVDAEIYPEIKKFPKVCIFFDKPSIGETIQIGEDHFKVIKILHIPSVSNLHYSQECEYPIIFVEFS